MSRRKIWISLLGGLAAAGGVAAWLLARPATTRAVTLAALPTGAFTNARGESVRVAAFELGRTEVSVAEYGACVAIRKCTPAEAKSAACNAKHAARDAHPINCVSWDQAFAYCAWKGLRLPTEDEWEWAARGARSEHAYPWGTEPLDGRACWNREGGTCPIGSMPGGASPQGIVDLAGGVWEWTDGFADVGSAMRVFRGGGWGSKKVEHLGATGRDRFLAHGRSDQVGFRCARSAGAP